MKTLPFVFTALASWCLVGCGPKNEPAAQEAGSEAKSDAKISGLPVAQWIAQVDDKNDAIAGACLLTLLKAGHLEGVAPARLSAMVNDPTRSRVVRGRAAVGLFVLNGDTSAATPDIVPVLQTLVQEETDNDMATKAGQLLGKHRSAQP